MDGVSPRAGGEQPDQGQLPYKQESDTETHSGAF
jgi:hypothetical protein